MNKRGHRMKELQKKDGYEYYKKYRKKKNYKQQKKLYKSIKSQRKCNKNKI